MSPADQVGDAASPHSKPSPGGLNLLVQTPSPPFAPVVEKGQKLGRNLLPFEVDFRELAESWSKIRFKNRIFRMVTSRGLKRENQSEIQCGVCLVDCGNGGLLAHLNRSIFRKQSKFLT